jgi:enoyl-CoA hydratase
VNQFILVDRDAGVGVITLNRPERFNAWHTPMRHEVAAALDAFNSDEAINAVIITGSGDKAFCAGQDLAETQAYDTDAQADDWMTEWDQLYGALRRMDKPTIAALNGLAAGSAFQFALLCDIRVAHPGVRMGQPEINSGIPSITGAWVIQTAVSYARTVEMMLTGRMIEGEECLRMGLVHHLVAQDQVLAMAIQIARELAAKPPMAMKLNKQRLREITEAGFRDAMDSGHAYHRKAFGSGEPQARMASFFAARAARKAAAGKGHDE